MKHIRNIIYISFISILLFTFSVHSYASTETRKQILAMPNGNLLVEKIDNFVEIVGKKAQSDDTFRSNMLGAINAAQAKYKSKSDARSQKILIILHYLDERFTAEVNMASSNLVDRFQKIESEKYKDRSQTRINTAKKKNYQRIHRNTR